METQGDRIVDIPLRQVEGKEFFTAEIDRALLQGEVHFTVHSLKDLSSRTQRASNSSHSKTSESTRCHFIRRKRCRET